MLPVHIVWHSFIRGGQLSKYVICPTEEDVMVECRPISVSRIRS